MGWVCTRTKVMIFDEKSVSPRTFSALADVDNSSSASAMGTSSMSRARQTSAPVAGDPDPADSSALNDVDTHLCEDELSYLLMCSPFSLADARSVGPDRSENPREDGDLYRLRAGRT